MNMDIMEKYIGWWFKILPIVGLLWVIFYVSIGLLIAAALCKYLGWL